MTHLELSNVVTGYVDGALDAAQTRQVEEHLESCGACRIMVDDIRFAQAVCHDAPVMEPPPWLLPRIVRATLGERKPSLKERLAGISRLIFRPQLAYSLSMAVFSLSFILYAAKVNLRRLRLRDLNPQTWAHRADRRGHMLLARAEKYYYDLRFVYEVQSILRGMRQEPETQPGAPEKLRTPANPSSDRYPAAGTELAWSLAPHRRVASAGRIELTAIGIKRKAANKELTR